MVNGREHSQVISSTLSLSQTLGEGEVIYLCFCCHANIMCFCDLISMLFQIGYKLLQDGGVDQKVSTLYSLLSSSVNISRRALGILLEQVGPSFPFFLGLCAL